jgi:peptidoglycan biosynthesis protein MviN/MurJ (putative lipid II flippase)
MEEHPLNPQRGLDDPDYARFAWGRFRALMAWMTLAAAVCVAVVIAVMAWVQGPLHLVTMLAIVGGVGGSVMMAAALMGLVFLSSGTGHDEDVTRVD